MASSVPGIRVQKYLALSGVGSRRRCEELILAGRVAVDGQTVRELGTRVDPQSQGVTLDGQAVRPERTVYYLVYKPRGYLSTTYDPSGRPIVLDLLPQVPQRVYTVGRLDEESEGLMLLTNDGELANRLAHPRYGVEKTYIAQVAGQPSQALLERLVKGVWLAEGKVRARRVRRLKTRGQSTLLEIVLAEGRNREVRRMLARFGHKVLHLRRTAIDRVTVAGLAPGKFRRLTPEELDRLRRVASRTPMKRGGSQAEPSSRVSDSVRTKRARSRRKKSKRPREAPGT